MSIELVLSKIIENAFNMDYQMMLAVTIRTAIVTLLIVFVIVVLTYIGYNFIY